MTYLNEPTDWASIKKLMGTSEFKNKIFNLDAKTLKPETMKKIASYTGKDDFTEHNMAAKSFMAGVLTKWVRAIEDYYKAY